MIIYIDYMLQWYFGYMRLYKMLQKLISPDFFFFFLNVAAEHDTTCLTFCFFWTVLIWRNKSEVAVTLIGCF